VVRRRALLKLHAPELPCQWYGAKPLGRNFNLGLGQAEATRPFDVRCKKDLGSEKYRVDTKYQR